MSINSIAPILNQDTQQTNKYNLRSNPTLPAVNKSIEVTLISPPKTSKETRTANRCMAISKSIFNTISKGELTLPHFTAQLNSKNKNKIEFGFRNSGLPSRKYTSIVFIDRIVKKENKLARGKIGLIKLLQDTYNNTKTNKDEFLNIIEKIDSNNLTDVSKVNAIQNIILSSQNEEKQNSSTNIEKNNKEKKTYYRTKCFYIE